VVIAIVAFIVFMEQAQRRIPVQYAKRMVGRRMYGGTSTYIPMKVNQAGVIPVIFASSLLYIPTLAAQLFGTRTSRRAGWPGSPGTSSRATPFSTCSPSSC
jgi:Preprotein translocase subunit SecY